MRCTENKKEAEEALKICKSNETNRKRPVTTVFF